MALLQLRGIVKSFGSRTILDGLDFDIEPGARVGVIGPNGGGKSTLMRILAGLEEPDAGEAARASARVSAATGGGRCAARARDGARRAARPGRPRARARARLGAARLARRRPRP